ncbi:MAG TPA: ATP-binding protein [Candidatus Binatia bacterium]|nr:ATP-binding protein [Candidatus Binatia bacterium]
MRIKTQFILCLIAFTIVLSVIAASVATTEQQTAYLTTQQAISRNIERGANSLNSVSIDYFLYQEDLQLSKWNSTISSLSSDLQNLDIKDNTQQMIATNVANDLQNLNVQFEDVVVYLQQSPRNVSVRIDPAFQFRWSNMALQSETFASDASQLSNSINDQVRQANFANILLVLSLIVTFGAFLLTIYLLIFRKTLKSVSGLQKGIGIIGSGNLDYTINAGKSDEISDVARSVNQMAISLKTVTASKKDLEQTQASLRESEQRWATTLASIGDAVIATNLSGKIVFMNGEAEELTGWSLSETLSKSVKKVFNIINEHSRLEVESPIERVLREGIVIGLANHTILIRKDGVEVPIDDSGAPIKDKQGKTTGVVLVFRDITERKKAEDERNRMQTKIEESAIQLEEYASQMEELAEQRAEQLKNAERLAAIGATAGMVGHDIRNPLQAITGDIYLAKTDLASTPDSEEKKNALESLDEIEKNVAYINKIVQDLQDFARPLNPHTEVTDLKRIIDDLLEKNGLPKNVKLSVIIETGKVVADPTFINRIMYNLVNNAVQAMPDGGKLTIHTYKQSNDVVIEVKDTGVGIPEAVKSKLFTPMFTTKSKGQGFGLAVIKRMTEALDGTVTFESQEGKGTTFTIRLPYSRKHSSHRQP